MTELKISLPIRTSSNRLRFQSPSVVLPSRLLCLEHYLRIAFQRKTKSSYKSRPCVGCVFLLPDLAPIGNPLLLQMRLHQGFFYLDTAFQRQHFCWQPFSSSSLQPTDCNYFAGNQIRVFQRILRNYYGDFDSIHSLKPCILGPVGNSH